MEEKLPKATHQGVLTIGAVRIPCAVLDDGTRVLRERSIAKALRKKGGGAHWKRKRLLEDGALFPEYVSAKNIEKFIDNDIKETLLNPITYLTKMGKQVGGIEATLLSEICNIWLKARENGALSSAQEKTAKQAEILMRGFAHVGIVALVDEATGYQEIRDRLALQAILDKYVTDEWAKWTRTFPDEFYKQLFRLKGIDYPPLKINKPSYVGHWTNDIVYSRLAPGVLKTLREKNPRRASGHRARRHHQHLTRDLGHPILTEHLSNTTFLMRGCTKWSDFKRKLNRAMPKYGDTIELNIDEPEDE